MQGRGGAPNAEDEMKANAELLGCQSAVFVIICQHPNISQDPNVEPTFVENCNGFRTAQVTNATRNESDESSQ